MRNHIEELIKRIHIYEINKTKKSNNCRLRHANCRKIKAKEKKMSKNIIFASLYLSLINHFLYKKIFYERFELYKSSLIKCNYIIIYMFKLRISLFQLYIYSDEKVSSQEHFSFRFLVETESSLTKKYDP